MALYRKIGRELLMSQILIIEDDIDFNQVLCRALAKKGYGVLSATNGKQGIDLYKSHPADLVITDILMPERDGIEVITYLRRIAPGVKIIAISGGGAGGSGEDYLRSTRTVCNIQYTLAKPFGKNQLLKMIQELLKQ